MSLITKSSIATILGIDSSLIDDNVYIWATAQFYKITGLQSAEVTKNYRKHLPYATCVIQLDHKNIKEITTIKQDNETLDYDNYDEYTLNPDTGTVVFSSEVCGYVEIEYKVNAFTEESLHSYLIALLTYRSMMVFTPQNINNLQSVTIGRFSKKVSSDNPLESIDDEIERIRILIQEDTGGLSFGSIA